MTGLRRRLPEVAGLLPALLVVGVPVLWLLGAALTDLLRHGAGLDGRASGLFLRSLGLGAGAALLCLMLGAPYGWWAARRRLPFRRGLLPAALVPLLIPSYAVSHALGLLFAREGWLNRLLVQTGLPGAPYDPFGSAPLAVWCLAAALWPITAGLAWVAARSVPAELEDALALETSRPRAAFLAARPVLLPALVAALVLSGLLAQADFGVPSSLGVTSYPVEIVTRFQHDRDPAAAARLVLPLVPVVAPALVALGWLLRRFARVPSGLPAGDLRGPGDLLRAAVCGTIVLATAGVPLAVLVERSLPLSTYVDVWRESSDHLLNTLVAAGGGGILAVLLAVAWGSPAAGGRRALSLVLTFPLLVPASLLGIAWIRLQEMDPLLPWDGDLAGLAADMGPAGVVLLPLRLRALLLLYGSLFFAVAGWVAAAGWAGVDRDLLDDARLSGAGAGARFRAVVWPVMRPWLTAGGVAATVLASRDMDATALLRVPGGDTLAFRIHDYLHFAPGPKLAALCVLVVLLGLLCAAAARMTLRSRSTT